MTLQAFWLVLGEIIENAWSVTLFLQNEWAHVTLQAFLLILCEKTLIFYNTLCFFCAVWPDLSESVGVLLQNYALGVVFGTHPQNPRKWCHEVRFRCLLPRAPVGQDDGSLSKLPQIRLHTHFYSIGQVLGFGSSLKANIILWHVYVCPSITSQPTSTSLVGEPSG